MKKISFILLLALFAVSSVKAQITLTVTNNTCESINFIANYSAGGLCTLPDANYGLMTIAGGGTVYPTLSIPSGAWDFATVGDACSTCYYYGVGNYCTWLCPAPSGPCVISFTYSWVSAIPPCPGTTITATWTNTGGGSATLDFN